MANQERNTEATDDAMSSSWDFNLYLPMDIIVHILNRLPVKSLLRFRCVCKSFRHLISNPTFISSHLLHHSTTSAATIFTFKRVITSTLSLLQSPSSSRNPINLVYPFANQTRNVHLIGSINGLLCLCLCLSNHPFHCHRRIILLLWNPATKLFKSLPPPTIEIPPIFFDLSLGFGFQCHSTTSSSDYKVVRIVSFNFQARFEVYSAISDCWKEIQVMDLGFYFHKLSCEVIVNGAPYWMLSTISNHRLSFTWFDVQNEAFIMLPSLDLSQFYIGTIAQASLVDWKDNAAVVVSCRRNTSFDVWMIEDSCDGVSNWCKKFVIGPSLGVDPFWFLQWTNNGEIIAESWEGLFLYNPRNGEIKEIQIDGVDYEVYNYLDSSAYNYVESLVSIIGFRLQELNN